MEVTQHFCLELATTTLRGEASSHTDETSARHWQHSSCLLKHVLTTQQNPPEANLATCSGITILAVEIPGMLHAQTLCAIVWTA